VRPGAVRRFFSLPSSLDVIFAGPGIGVGSHFASPAPARQVVRSESEIQSPAGVRRSVLACGSARPDAPCPARGFRRSTRRRVLARDDASARLVAIPAATRTTSSRGPFFGAGQTPAPPSECSFHQQQRPSEPERRAPPGASISPPLPEPSWDRKTRQPAGTIFGRLEGPPTGGQVVHFPGGAHEPGVPGTRKSKMRVLIVNPDYS